MLATAKVETNFGKFRDTTHNSAGEGWFQFDPGNVADVRSRFMHSYKKYLDKAMDLYDFYIGDVNYHSLRQAPQASAFMTGFKYYLVPWKMPEIDDIYGMWKYYKIWFNSVDGITTEKKFREAYDWALDMAGKYPYKGEKDD